MFEEVENAGSEISYRYNNCRNCKTCKEHARADMMSVKEEVEQNVINKSATVDTDRRTTTALLLLMFNPLHKLAPNKDKAFRIYNQQVKKDGSHSCQLIFSRSKLISDSLSQPRAELFAATMNARTGEIIGRALQENHKGKMKLTDSQVVLHWLSNYEKTVKQWMRNRVIEILRFTD